MDSIGEMVFPLINKETFSLIVSPLSLRESSAFGLPLKKVLF
jgi:hypothetical protein